MDLKANIEEKKELLEQVWSEMDKRKKEVDKLQSELTQLENQGYVIQGAILAYEELEKELESELEKA